MYKNEKGEFILEITPYYPGFCYHLRSTEEQKKIPTFVEWIQTYKSCLKRVIPREVAQEWVKKARVLEKIIHDYNFSDKK